MNKQLELPLVGKKRKEIEEDVGRNLKRMEGIYCPMRRLPKLTADPKQYEFWQDFGALLYAYGCVAAFVKRVLLPFVYKGAEFNPPPGVTGSEYEQLKSNHYHSHVKPLKKAFAENDQMLVQKVLYRIQERYEKGENIDGRESVNRTQEERESERYLAQRGITVDQAKEEVANYIFSHAKMILETPVNRPWENENPLNCSSFSFNSNHKPFKSITLFALTYWGVVKKLYTYTDFAAMMSSTVPVQPVANELNLVKYSCGLSVKLVYRTQFEIGSFLTSINAASLYDSKPFAEVRFPLATTSKVRDVTTSLATAHLFIDDGYGQGVIRDVYGEDMQCVDRHQYNWSSKTMRRDPYSESYVERAKQRKLNETERGPFAESDKGTWSYLLENPASVTCKFVHLYACVLLYLHPVLIRLGT